MGYWSIESKRKVQRTCNQAGCFAQRVGQVPRPNSTREAAPSATGTGQCRQGLCRRETNDMKSAYDQQVISLATQSADRSKEAMQNRRKAEEAKQDAENTKQSAAEAEGELARRASRSMSAMQRKQAREKKAAAQKVQKAEADAMDEVSH